jgi:hypothetical protein
LITNIGKNILAKYLVGQAPAYASFLALGVGKAPLDSSSEFDDYLEQKSLDFEVLRIPISSRGYVYDEQGVANIVFLGELPSDQRYEFTEIGVYSAKANPAAGSLDSRMIYTFSESENWEYHDEISARGIPTIIEPLYLDQESNVIAVTEKTFRTNSNNLIFSNDFRLFRNERPRFLDRVLIMRGDVSELEVREGRLLPKISDESGYYSSHIHLTGVSPNLNRNAPTDELRLAFSVIDKEVVGEGGQDAVIESVKILVEFASTDSIDPENFARMEIDLGNEDVIFAENRYIVVKESLENLIKSSGFTWNTINVVKIYVSVYEIAENPEDPPVISENFYVGLDGLRFENLTSQNPLYGLTGYSVVRNDTASPIVKEPNSSNLLEFRFGMDVV